MSDNHKGIVCKITVRKHPYDENGKRLPGVTFEENGRVKAKSIRGVKSEGYWVPLHMLEFTGVHHTKFVEGQLISECNEVPICSKYVTPATYLRMQRNKNTPVYDNVLNFPKHFDTSNLQQLQHIPTGATIYVTEKLHGTSVRYGYVPVKQKLNRVKRFINKFYKVWESEKYEMVVGTRNTIITKNKEGQYTGGLDNNGNPYVAHLPHIKGLREDEIIYGEIVGYMPNGEALFKQDISSIPELKKVFNKDTLVYDYGCEVGQSKLFVYRITLKGKDLLWGEVVTRCQQLGLQHVPFLVTIKVDDIPSYKNMLEEYIKDFLPSKNDIYYITWPTTHLREGICVRVEKDEYMKIYKNKCFYFKVAEGIIKDKADYIDSEEVQ